MALALTTKTAGDSCDLRVCGGQGRGRTADLPIFRRPASIAACLTHPRNVSGTTPTRRQIRTTARFSDSSGFSVRLGNHALRPLTQLVGVLPGCWHNSTSPWSQTLHQSGGGSDWINPAGGEGDGQARRNCRSWPHGTCYWSAARGVRHDHLMPQSPTSRRRAVPLRLVREGSSLWMRHSVGRGTGGPESTGLISRKVLAALGPAG